MIGLAGFIECDAGLQGIHQGARVLLRDEFQGLPCGCQGLREPACFCVGGGQGFENVRPPARIEPVGPLGKLDRLGAVSQRGLRAGRPQPSQVPQRIRVARFDLERRAIMGQGLIEPALRIKTPPRLLWAVAKLGWTFSAWR